MFSRWCSFRLPAEAVSGTLSDRRAADEIGCAVLIFAKPQVKNGVSVVVHWLNRSTTRDQRVPSRSASGSNVARAATSTSGGRRQRRRACGAPLRRVTGLAPGCTASAAVDGTTPTPVGFHSRESAERIQALVFPQGYGPPVLTEGGAIRTTLSACRRSTPDAPSRPRYTAKSRRAFRPSSAAPRRNPWTAIAESLVAAANDTNDRSRDASVRSLVSGGRDKARHGPIETTRTLSAVEGMKVPLKSAQCSGRTSV